VLDLPQPALLKPVELWTGKQLFGLLLRPNASVK
jgi:DNA-directed RNA polymerase III subunit RPC1